MRTGQISRITRGLMLVVGLLTIAGLLSILLERTQPENYYLLELRESFIRLFNLDAEANIPVWYSSALLLASSALLATIACSAKDAGDPFSRDWKALSAVFLYMSIDETAVLHEMTIKPTRALLHLEGLEHFAWIVPATAAVAVFLILFLRFLRYLPDDTRRLFLIAGGVYVGGAAGLDAVGALLAAAFGLESMFYESAVLVEEFCEMTGIVIFLYALMIYRNRLPKCPGTTVPQLDS